MCSFAPDCIPITLPLSLLFLLRQKRCKTLRWTDFFNFLLFCSYFGRLCLLLTATTLFDGVFDGFVTLASAPSWDDVTLHTILLTFSSSQECGPLADLADLPVSNGKLNNKNKKRRTTKTT